MRNLHNPAPGLVSVLFAHLFFAARAHVRAIITLHDLLIRRLAGKARIRAQILRVIWRDFGALDNDRIQRSGQLRHVVSISADYDDRQRDATLVDQQHSLAPIFFHDPTTPNRQGNDIGTQYRSAIFYHSPGQRTIAEEVIARMGAAKLWREPIVTEVAPASAFWVAEDYHQEYFSRNPRQSYCMLVVDPKVSKFRKHFRDRLKK